MTPFQLKILDIVDDNNDEQLNIEKEMTRVLFQGKPRKLPPGESVSGTRSLPRTYRCQQACGLAVIRCYHVLPSHVTPTHSSPLVKAAMSLQVS
jgi:hypothetical protein